MLQPKVGPFVISEFLVLKINRKSTSRLSILTLLLRQIADPEKEIFKVEMLEDGMDPIYQSILKLKEDMLVKVSLQKVIVNIKRLDKPSYRMVSYKPLKPIEILGQLTKEND